MSAHKTEWAGKWLLKKNNNRFIEGFVRVILFHNLSEDEIIIYFYYFKSYLILAGIFPYAGGIFPLCRGHFLIWVNFSLGMVRPQRC